MVTDAGVGRFISYLSIIADICLLLQLFRYGLARQYSFLAAYYFTDIFETVLTGPVSAYSPKYFYIYISGEFAKTALAAGFAIQLWRLALRTYPALARFGRRFGVYIQVAAGVSALAGLLLDPPRGYFQTVYTHYFNTLEGAADAMIFVFVSLATIFLLWFPVEVSRNTAIFAAVFVLLMLKDWIMLLILNLHPRELATASSENILLDLTGQIYWIFMVKPFGEVVTTVTGHRWNLAETQRLLGQLNAMNARLSHMAQGQ